MATIASFTKFLPDDRLKLRATNLGAVTSFTSAAFDLGRLTAYWTKNEWGIAASLAVLIGIQAISMAQGQVYTFALQVDSSAAFGSPTTVASQIISLTAAGAAAQFVMELTREALVNMDATATHMRLVVTSAGVAEVGSIAFSSVANDADTVIINDGVHTAVTFTFGDGTGGTVDKGSTATNSAQNLKTAIAAKVTAELLAVSATGAAATLTLTNNAANTGGSITKSDVDNDYTITQFAAGGDASITFWSYIRGH